MNKSSVLSGGHNHQAADETHLSAESSHSFASPPALPCFLLLCGSEGDVMTMSTPCFLRVGECVFAFQANGVARSSVTFFCATSAF
jgi:hypothetical protein